MKLTTVTHVSVDGVMQGLGGPGEDRRGGFERGGWAPPLFVDDALLGVDGATDDVAPRVIGQSAEHAVEVGRSDLHRYNHMVVSLACQATTVLA